MGMMSGMGGGLMLVGMGVQSPFWPSQFC